jgi:endo-beta-N-acetylglucosaminidase D
MKDIKDVVVWLEEEIAHFEMAVEEHNYVSKADEIRYRMAQELLAWILEYKFDPKYSVSRVPCEVEQGVLSIRHDTKAFGGRR